MENRDKGEDLRRLADAFYCNLQIDNCEWGAIGIDCKKPFGNSDVAGDMYQILDMKPIVQCPNCGSTYTEDQKAYVTDLYFSKLVPYLKESWHRLQDLCE